jgi:hypothetical protein
LPANPKTGRERNCNAVIVPLSSAQGYDTSVRLRS